MYFSFGWPRILRVPEADPPSPVSQVVANRDKIIFAVLTHSSLSIWTSRVSNVTCEMANSLEWEIKRWIFFK